MEYVGLVVVVDSVLAEVGYIVVWLIVFGRLPGCHHTSSWLLHLLREV